MFDHLRNSEVIPRATHRSSKRTKEAKPEFKDEQLEKAVEYLDGQIKTAADNPVKKAG